MCQASCTSSSFNLGNKAPRGNCAHPHLTARKPQTLRSPETSQEVRTLACGRAGRDRPQPITSLGRGTQLLASRNSTAPLSEPTWVVLFLSFCCFGLDKQPLMDCWSCKTVLNKIDSVSRKASKSFRQSFPTCLQRTSGWIRPLPPGLWSDPLPRCPRWPTCSHRDMLSGDKAQRKRPRLRPISGKNLQARSQSAANTTAFNCR